MSKSATEVATVTKAQMLRTFLEAFCISLHLNKGVQKTVTGVFRNKVASGGTFHPGAIVSGLAASREVLESQRDAIDAVLAAWPEDGEVISDPSINTVIHGKLGEQWSLGRFLYDFAKKGNQKCQVMAQIGAELVG